jgi:hypothetical protein
MVATPHLIVTFIRSTYISCLVFLRTSVLGPVKCGEGCNCRNCRSDGIWKYFYNLIKVPVELSEYKDCNMVLFFSYKPLFDGYDEACNYLHIYVHTLHIYVHTVHIFFSNHFNIQLYNDKLTIIYATNKHLFNLLLLWHLNNTLRYCLLQTVRRERRILNLPSLEIKRTWICFFAYSRPVSFKCKCIEYN